VGLDWERGVGLGAWGWVGSVGLGWERGMEKTQQLWLGNSRQSFTVVANPFKPWRHTANHHQTNSKPNTLNPTRSRHSHTSPTPHPPPPPHVRARHPPRLLARLPFSSSSSTIRSASSSASTRTHSASLVGSDVASKDLQLRVGGVWGGLGELEGVEGVGGVEGGGVGGG